MNSEEEQLRRRIEERQLALNEKVNSLRERVERLKRLGDINSAIKERPGVVLAGSVLTGFILRKVAGRKNRNLVGDGAYRTDYRKAPTVGQRLWDPVIAIITGVATRAAIDLVAEIAKPLIPWRHKADQPRQNSRNNSNLTSKSKD